MLGADLQQTGLSVGDAVPLGLPDVEAGVIPAAWIVLKPGESVTEADIQAFVADQVATYKQVRRITFVEAVPKSPSGKILRRVLVEADRARAQTL